MSQQLGCEDVGKEREQSVRGAVETEEGETEETVEGIRVNYLVD